MKVEKQMETFYVLNYQQINIEIRCGINYLDFGYYRNFYL